MKLLWLSNCAFTEGKAQATGTWLLAMGEALAHSNDVHICNITHGDVSKPVRRDCHNIVQWIIPRERDLKDGLPSKETLNFLQSVERDFDADVIHVWGTENYWAAVAADDLFKAPVILDMQGILYAYAEVYFGGLTIKELFKCIGLKELLLPKRHLYFRQRDFESRGVIEKRAIRRMRFISVQSEWVRMHIELQNPTCKIFSTGILLRDEFHQALPWCTGAKERKIVFTSSSGSTSYKGLHVLFKSFAHLKVFHPDAELHIAGGFGGGRLQDGYSAWLVSEARRLGIESSITWLGSLSADQIVEEFLSASVVVVPSFVETYCLALAEAMLVGVPCVVSYAGAMPELAEPELSALFFTPGDHVGCARQIRRILDSSDLAGKLSCRSRSIGLARNESGDIVRRQLEIYNSVLGFKP